MRSLKTSSSLIKNYYKRVLYFVDDFSLRFEKNTFEQDSSDSCMLRSFKYFNDSHSKNITFEIKDWEQVKKISDKE